MDSADVNSTYLFAPVLSVLCVIVFSAWVSKYIAISPRQPATAAPPQKKNSAFVRSIPSSFRIPQGETIILLDHTPSSNASKKKSARHCRLSSPGCYGFDSDSSDSEEEPNPKGCPIGDEEKSSPATKIFTSFATENVVNAQNEYVASDASRYISAPISCTFRPSSHSTSKSRRLSSPMASSYESETEDMDGPEPKLTFSIPHTPQSSRTTNLLSSPASPRGCLNFARTPDGNHTTPSGSVTADSPVSLWPEKMKLDRLTSRLLQKEKEYAEKLGSFTESRVTALKQEIAAERNRVDELVEQQRATAVARERERCVDQWLHTLRAGSGIFGRGSSRVDTQAASVTLKDFEDSIKHLKSPDIMATLDEGINGEVKVAWEDLQECKRLCKSVVQHAKHIASLCQTKAAADFEAALGLAHSLKDEVLNSSLAKALHSVGEESIVQSWKVLEAVDRAVEKKQASKAESTTTKASSAGAESSHTVGASQTCLENLPPYVREAFTQIEWLRMAVAQRDKNKTAGLAECIDSSLRHCADQIRAIGNMTSEERGTAALLQVISAVEDCVESCVSAATFESPKVYILLELFTALLQQTITADSEELVLMLGHVCGALCRMTGKTGGRVLRAMLNSSCRLTVPHIEPTPRVDCVPPADGEEQQRRVVMLMACQMAGFDAPAMTDLAAGWVWLRRVGILIHQHSSTSGTVSHLCRITRSFLRIAGSSLREAYGKEFIKLLEKIRATLPGDAAGAGAKDLRELLVSSLQTGLVPTVLFKNQDAYGIYAGTVVRSLAVVQAEANALDADKGEEMKGHRRALGVAQISLPFNILGPDVSSQNKAVTSLCDQIASAAGYQSGHYLKYMLFKIAYASVSNALAGQFILKEGHAGPLAAVICRTAEKFPSMSELFRMQIYKTCPPTIPKFKSDEGGEEFCIAMGFIKVKGAWETPTAWLDRMNKVVGLFASVVAYPGANPLSLDDGWIWLARVTNMCLRGTPPAPTAKFLDTFLRLAGPAMLKKYGPYFMSVLLMIQNRICPTLSDSGDFSYHRDLLVDFLDQFISSNGEKSVPIK